MQRIHRAGSGGAPARLGAARAGEADEVAMAVLTGERNLLVPHHHQLEELAHRQLLGMDTFNIALFRRTRADKSSLHEALSVGRRWIGAVGICVHVNTPEENVVVVTQHRNPSIGMLRGEIGDERA